MRTQTVRLALGIATLLLLAPLGAGIVLGLKGGISPADEEACDGEVTKVKGTVTCVESEPAGNSHVEKETTSEKKGSEKSSHEKETEYCVNNPGGDPCPPGQNK